MLLSRLAATLVVYVIVLGMYHFYITITLVGPPVHSLPTSTGQLTYLATSHPLYMNKTSAFRSSRSSCSSCSSCSSRSSRSIAGFRGIRHIRRRTARR